MGSARSILSAQVEGESIGDVLVGVAIALDQFQFDFRNETIDTAIGGAYFEVAEGV